MKMKFAVGILVMLMTLAFGAAVVNATPVSCTATCSDTDGGNNTLVFGTVTAVDSHCRQTIINDSCDGASNNLKERLCIDNAYTFKNIKCSDLGANFVCNPQKNVCEEQIPETPEFTTIGAALALLGAAGIFMIRRRN
jgi:MYXO-CTERM domain-containing protein